mmetsp:Transcript_68533/g.61572  ORF Transcript_68533/g.61572 Transcript_68533/m.61572 type:complete len:217 (-) Transcript_68533:79-729(-)
MGCTCSLYGFWNRKSWGWQNCWGNKLSPKIWYSKADDDDTSQHLLDPYSFDHFAFGVIQYMVIPPYGAGQYCVYQPLTFGNEDGSNFPWQWFLINVSIHLSWELGENTPCIIYYFRQSGVDPVYVGDSVINSIGDMIVNALGYIITWLLVEYVAWWTPIILLVLLQLLSWYLGAGFIMVLIRIIKDCCKCCADESEKELDENQNGNDKKEEQIADI